MMASWRRLVARVLAFARPARAEHELARELAAHLALLEETFRRQGLSADAAAAAARRALGGVELVKDAQRDARSFRWLEDARRDMWRSLRALARRPAFTIVAVATLALGMGANTAIFSLIDRVILKPLSVPAPHDLFALRVVPASSQPGQDRFSSPTVDALRHALRGRDRLAAMGGLARFQTTTPTGSAQIETIQLVSGNYFDVIGVGAEAGRLLTPQDDVTVDAHPVAVVSHAFWLRRLAGDPSAVGETLTVNGSPLTIVGVVPRAFSGLWTDAPVSVWVPLAMQHGVRYLQNFSSGHAEIDRPWMAQPDIRWLDVLYRGASDTRVRDLAALDALFHGTVASSPLAGDVDRRPAGVEPHLAFKSAAAGFSSLRGEYSARLLLLMGLVAVVLLIACANLANLLLAHGVSRSREIAIRSALGATRSSLVRQWLVESLVLSILGGLAGLIVAAWTSDALAAMTVGASADLAHFVLDGRVLAFTAGLMIATTLGFGLLPALRLTRVDTDALRAGGRATAHASGTVMNAALALQVALSVVVLVAAGLFSRTLHNLSTIDLGFDATHLVSARFDHRSAGYAGDRTAQLYDRLVASITRLPGVESAAAASCGVISQCDNTAGSYTFPDYAPSSGERIAIRENRIGVDYFRVVGMPVVEGRSFTTDDSGESPKVAVVNQALARTYFGTPHAVGRHFRHDLGRGDDEYEVIGVVRDARVFDVHDAPGPMIYFPVRQMPLSPYGGGINVRAADPLLALAAIRAVVGAIDPNLPILSLTTTGEAAASALGRERLLAYLASGFAGMATVLASIGIYGVVSFGMTRRVAEIGLRMALGATSWDIARVVLSASMRWVGLGLMSGIFLAFATSRLLRALLSGMLFDVTPTDPAAFVAAILTLAAIAVIAVLVPVRRAIGIDPRRALDCD
ncbi:MAG TPA: ABC transporter permease [Vicinamibacterales bacterium]|nr:ABC transporter permease [Vicinamibacterales bacterium]